MVLCLNLAKPHVFACCDGKKTSFMLHFIYMCVMYKYHLHLRLASVSHVIQLFTYHRYTLPTQIRTCHTHAHAHARAHTHHAQTCLHLLHMKATQSLLSLLPTTPARILEDSHLKHILRHPGHVKLRRLLRPMHECCTHARLLCPMHECCTHARLLRPMHECCEC